LDKQLKYADAQGIRLAVIIGPDEATANKATLKNLTDRSQITVAMADLTAKVREVLDGSSGS
jgi:histidyl-tRNA synthetase